MIASRRVVRTIPPVVADKGTLDAARDGCRMPPMALLLSASLRSLGGVGARPRSCRGRSTSKFLKEGRCGVCQRRCVMQCARRLFISDGYAPAAFVAIVPSLRRLPTNGGCDEKQWRSTPRWSLYVHHCLG